MDTLLTWGNDVSPESRIYVFSGLGAVIVAIMAIIHGNKNCRKAIGEDVTTGAEYGVEKMKENSEQNGRS